MYDRVNVSVEGTDGSLSLTTPKGRFNLTARPRICDSAGSPPGHIRRIRDPTVCPRSCAYQRSRTRPPHTHTPVIVKAGYPPRPLTAVIPELPLSSLGLAPGDQLIVVQKSGSAAPPGVSSAAPPISPVNQRSPPAGRSPPSSNPRQAAPVASTTEGDGPDYVDVDGGYLIHRVRRVVDYLRAGHCHLMSACFCRSCRTIIRVCLPPSRSSLSKICERRP